MELLILIVGVVAVLILLLRRGRAGASGEYVHGSERLDLGDDEANLRAAQFPGPGGPLKGSGGGNVSGGG